MSKNGLPSSAPAPSATPALAEHLAATMRRLRAERGWSLDRAAGETGVSKAMLGQIERAESSPTVATLWRIASGFHTPLSAFIEPPVRHEEAAFRCAAALRDRPASDPMWVAPLFPYDAHLGFELLELTLAPGYERHSEPHLAGVVEHVIVIHGTLEVLIDGCWHPLKEGDAVRFAADRPHGYRNLGDAPAVCHNLICYTGVATPRSAPPHTG
ncbi:helix-turn-helix domain-containing protein [Aromatoleum petrolei]|uniref:Cupin domain-containing protein n=1 Tax=Aromatoleum petrolei TaxID=76116 RepID=A0ABX1MQG0_9RHOO|nr:cupin domain-containing protein [Aromatoleum petrolei]NMF90187.1 cupin domain-containing protein [Aromatoleum petrolei]QTQ35512.1 Transcriptional regulator, Xre family [Aromatoleum petrolei]